MSIIGRACVREVWYGWRWFYQKRHTGRLIRLFQRGQDEEERMVAWLRGIGAIIEDKDPQTGAQFLISEMGGHIGGSQDGRIWNLERFGLVGKGVCEFKTHNDKSFKELKTKGVLSAKLEHYVQMQMYMGYEGLGWALYMAVNKNDDELHIEIVPFKQEIFEQYKDRAYAVVAARHPPARISEDATWFKCKMCDFREICHYNHVPQKNCRTCINSVAKEDGTWYCERWRDTIPAHVIKSGCDVWEAIRDAKA